MELALHLGKEIYVFFFKYGKIGILGIAISSFIIGYSIFKTLKLIKKYEIENYNELLELMIGKFENKYIDLKVILNFIINIFLLISFFIMSAGINAYFKQELAISEIVSSIFVSIFCYIILNKEAKGIILLNSILMPITIMFLLLLGVEMLNVKPSLPSGENSGLWIISAILYASYNSITLISILIPMKEYIRSKKDIFKVTIICIISIIVLALIIFMLLLTLKEDIERIELPAVSSAGNFGAFYKYLYGVIILGAIITTAISSAYGFLKNVSRTREKYKKYNKTICLIAIFVSLFGFSNLVNSLYPVFGILGTIQLIFILKCK